MKEKRNCIICKMEISCKTTSNRKTCSTECSRKNDNELRKKYHQSDKYREYQKKYRQTEERREYHREYQKKYCQTEKYREYQRRYYQLHKSEEKKKEEGIE